MLINESMIDESLEYILKKIDQNLETFRDKFPAPESTNYVYKPIENTCWTGSFWTGMLWLAYELTGNEKYREVAEIQVESFHNRIVNKIQTDTHDLGFLYTLSCVSAYKITGNQSAKETAIMAADLLITRYKEKGEFIQAWGDINVPGNNRLIIDCLMNLPLLHWASEETGDSKYADIANKHAKTAIKYVIREDNTTHHTFYFDPENGNPLKGVTCQGYSDNSCWARGQAWGVYGIPLSYAYTKDESLIKKFNDVTDCFISKLPSDYVPYWDMIFTEGDEPRDTSAAAIAICGILEMQKYYPNDQYFEFAEKMLLSLMHNYTTNNLPNANGILTDAMYSKPHGGKPESNIWGDYYYMEALMRLKKDWKMYW